MTDNAVHAASMEIPTDHPARQSTVLRDSSNDLWTTTNWNPEWFQKGYMVGGNARSLMRLSIALACIDVFSQDLAKAPLQLRRYLKNRRGSEIVGPGQHPVARLLDRRPSRYYGWFEWMRICGIFLACSSEYFAAALRRRDGDITEIQGFDKGKVTVNVNTQSRGYFYDVMPSTNHDEAQFGWARGRQDEDTVAHIRTRSLNGLDMLGTEKLMATAFELYSKMQSYQMNMFKAGGVPPLAFKFPDKMTPEQWDRLKNDLELAQREAYEKNRPIMLEGNGKEMPEIEKLSLSAVDSDFVKANESTALEVCRGFRIPPHRVYLLSQVKYDNQAEQDRQYVDASLVPAFRAIQECLEPVLLTEAEREDYCLAFDVDAAAGMDPERRQKIWEARWKGGMVEFDEMREGIGLNAAGGEIGRMRMMSGNFVLIDKDNDVILASGGSKPGEEGEETPPGAEGDQAPQDDAGKALPANVVRMR